MTMMRPIDPPPGAGARPARRRPASRSAAAPRETLWSRMVDRWRLTETQDEFDARQW